jgi:hypothetical protein
MGSVSGCRFAAFYCGVVVAAGLIATPARCIAEETTVATAEKLPAQFDVLNRFAGDWQTVAVLRRPGSPTREVSTKGQASCSATLGGRYYEFRTATIPPGDADLQVMTFDEQASVYRQWVFSSDGYRHEATGVWDPATSTMIWKGKTAGGEFVIEDRWVSADRLEWNLVRTNANGNVTQTITGAVSRPAK